MRTKAIVLHSPFEGSEHSVKVKNGKIIADNKSWIIGNTAPIIVKGKIGEYKLYILSHNKRVPISFDNALKPEVKKDYIPPSIARKLDDLTILGNMIKVRKPIGGFLPFMIGLFAGIIILYLLIVFKVFPVG